MNSIAQNIRFLVVVGLYLGIGGCTIFSSVERPSWVMGSNEQYPSARYLVGVGHGASRSVAEERAYAAVAKIFSAHVQSRVHDTEVFHLVEAEGSTQTRRELALERSTRVTTNKVLNNVQVLERWVHPDTKEVYVLAGLDRLQVERGLVEKIQAHDQTIEDDLQVSRNSSDKLIRIGKLKHAIQVWHERDVVIEDLRVIRESGSGIPARYRLSELTQELDAFVTEQFLVEVQIEGEYAPDVQSAIVQKLGQEGLPVMTDRSLSGTALEPQAALNNQAPDLLIQGMVRVWDIDTLDPLFVYARWCGDIQIVDRLQERVVGVVSRSGREGHVTSREARARASAVMQSTLAQEVMATIFSFLTRNSSERPSMSSSPCLSNLP
jgi:hypothetical protein